MRFGIFLIPCLRLRNWQGGVSRSLFGKVSHRKETSRSAISQRQDKNFACDSNEGILRSFPVFRRLEQTPTNSQFKTPPSAILQFPSPKNDCQSWNDQTFFSPSAKQNLALFSAWRGFAASSNASIFPLRRFLQSQKLVARDQR